MDERPNPPESESGYDLAGYFAALSRWCMKGDEDSDSADETST